MTKHIEAIHNTLDWIDPLRDAVVVGGAALSLQFDAIGLSEVETPDIDAVVPDEYFNDLLSTGSARDGVGVFRMRWWRGWAGENQVSNRSIDLYPKRTQEDMLPFTACSEMNGVFPLSYEQATMVPELTVVVDGIRCLKASEVLRWKAMVGREKDIETVERLLRSAADAGLIEPWESDCIQLWLDIRNAEPNIPMLHQNTSKTTFAPRVAAMVS